MALTINEPIKTVDSILTLALAANSQLLYVITTDIDLNAVNNYRINVEIRDAADTFALFDKVFSYIPNAAGVLDLDVGETVSRYMRDQGFFSFQYFLRVVEVWQGSGESSVDTTILQAILARKQLLSIGGANMWENLLREGIQPFETPFDGWFNFAKVPANPDWVLIDNGTTWISEVSTNPEATNFLQFNHAIKAGSYVFKASYRTGVDNNTSGTVRIKLWTNDGVVNITQVAVPISATFQDLFIPVVYGVDYNNISFNVEPDINDGTVVQFYFKSIEFVAGAKLLTKFINPVIWTGWGRTWNYLFDSEYVTRTGGTRAIYEQKTYNVNRIEDGNKFAAQVPNSSAIQTNIVPIDLSVMQNQTPFYIGVQVMLDFNLAGVSESLLYKVESECQNPIMLDWINSLGGVDQWLFSTSQAVQIVSDSGIVAERPINTDIEFITRTKQRFSNTFRQQITLRAHNLTFDQLLALQEIKQTESLRVYLSKDGANFIDGIVITTFTTDYNNKRVDHKFVVVIELPDGFIFEEGKLY